MHHADLRVWWVDSLTRDAVGRREGKKKHVSIILNVHTSVRERARKHLWTTAVHVRLCVSAVWQCLICTVMILKNVYLDILPFLDRCSNSFRADHSASLEFCRLLLVWKMKNYCCYLAFSVIWCVCVCFINCNLKLLWMEFGNWLWRPHW